MSPGMGFHRKVHRTEQKWPLPILPKPPVRKVPEGSWAPHTVGSKFPAPCILYFDAGCCGITVRAPSLIKSLTQTSLVFPSTLFLQRGSNQLNITGDAEQKARVVTEVTAVLSKPGLWLLLKNNHPDPHTKEAKLTLLFLPIKTKSTHS